MTGFPKWGRLVGGEFRKNGQKLHENYKINIFGEKRKGGHVSFRVAGVIHPVPPH